MEENSYYPLDLAHEFIINFSYSRARAKVYEYSTPWKINKRGFRRMSIAQVLSSEGHSGFYTAFGISLAAFISPLIGQWIQVSISGLGTQVDSLIIIAAISGIATGLLFSASPDRIADVWIEGKAKYSSWHELNPFKKNKECNKELQRLIAEIDQTVSNWDSPLWISTSVNCLSIVKSAIDAPQIQKTLWELKRRGGVGILFCMWSMSVWLNLQTNWLFWILLTISALGLAILFHTLFWGPATKIVNRVREFAYISYVNDSLHSYQPLRYGVTDDNVKDAINRLRESAKALEQVAIAGQWKRFDAMYDRYLHDLTRIRPRIAITTESLLAAWLGTFSEHYIAKSAGESVQEYKNWFLNVLEAFTLTGELEKLDWKIKPDADNYTDPKAIFWHPFDNLRSRAYVYRNYDYVAPLLDKAFNVLTEEDKILWINGAAQQPHQLPMLLKNSIYSFVCSYEGDELIPETYIKLAQNPGRLSDTTLLMLDRIYKISPPPDRGKSLKLSFFDKVYNDANVGGEVKEKARFYRNHFV